MKCVFVLCLLGLMALTLAKPQSNSRGCIYIFGHCKEECPEGTHSYNADCDELLPEATCENPSPELEPGDLCDYSACYCDPPTVRDSKTDKCVPLDQCT